MEINNRREAAQKMMHKYFTGKPCGRGHLTLRYTGTGACIECICLYGKKHYKEKRRREFKAQIEVFHADDLRQILAYVEALNFQRKITNECS